MKFTRYHRFSTLTAIAGIGMFMMAAPGAEAQTAAATQAGVAAAVRGEVQQVSLAARPPADRGPTVGHLVASGDRIYLNDRIATGPRAGLQIMLMDQSVFTIGPNAEMVIDRFVFDPDRDTGEVAASIVKGAFRFVSGRIAKSNPADMSLRVGSATLGIRGTSAAGNVSDTLPDGSPGETVDVVLLGPGPDNNADERSGRITLSNGGSNVEISRPGFGTTIVGGDGAPSQPERWSPQKLRSVTGQTTAGGSGSGSNGGENGTGGGNGEAGGGDSGSNGDGGSSGGGSSGVSGNFIQLSGQTLGSSLETVTTVAQNDAASAPAEETTETASETAIGNTSTALANVATFDDLRSISSGYASILFSNVPLDYVSGGTTQSGGSFDGGIVIDFASRTLAPFVSHAQYNFGQRSDQFVYVQAIDYSASSGPASVTADSISNPGYFATSSGSPSVLVQSAADVLRVESQVLNDPDSGTIANAGMMKVTVESGTDGTVISGGATSTAHITTVR